MALAAAARDAVCGLGGEELKGFEGYFYPVGLTRRGRPTFKILRGAHSGGGVIPEQQSPIQWGFTAFPGKRLLRF